MDTLKSNKKIVFFVMLFFVIFLLYRENERRKEEILKQNRTADRPLKTHIQLFLLIISGIHDI